MKMDTKAIREALENYRIGKVSNFSFKEFISWIRQLLDENERLQKELSTFEAEYVAFLNQHEQTQKECGNLLLEIEQLQADKAAAVDALRWYANDKQYGAIRLFPPIPDIPILHDVGEYARATIERIRGRERPKGSGSTAIPEPPREG